MAQLPIKLIKKLNHLNEIQDQKFGSTLQSCLNEIVALIGGGGKTTLPVFADTAAYEAACGKADGNIFYNSSTLTINYCADGAWVDMDIVNKCTQIDVNTAAISLNTTSITTIQTQLTQLLADYAAHNHDGANSVKIAIKNLDTTGQPLGTYFSSDGAGGLNCAPLNVDTALDVKALGTSVAVVDCLNFADTCFTVVATATGVDVRIPDLKTAITNIANNTSTITTNAAAIAALTTTVTANAACCAANQTAITALQTFDLAHDHSGGIDGQRLVPESSLLGQDNVGNNIPADYVLCATGTGFVDWIDPTTKPAPAPCLSNNAVNGVDPLKGIDVNGCVESKGIAGGGCVSVTDDAANNDVVVDIDLTNTTDIGVAVDPAADYLLVWDTSTGTCVKTLVSNLGGGGVSFTTGKGLDLSAADVLSLDLATLPAVPATTSLHDLEFVGVDAAGDCYKVTHEALNSNKCTVSFPNHNTVLGDQVYVQAPTGAWAKAQATSDTTLTWATVVEIIDANTVCVQSDGYYEFANPHGFLVGEAYWTDEIVPGIPTAIKPTTPGNYEDPAFLVVSPTKILIRSLVRADEI